jgi:S-DNA-T family DNA segregation ATPase FtsK/SpoIIIE
VGAVIAAGDEERIDRVMRMFAEQVEDRARRYAALNAATIDEYRANPGCEAEPRLLLLIDGFSAFRTAYEVGPSSAVFDRLLAVASDGRPVGVHVVLSADRLGSVPAALAGAVQRKVALRVSGEMEEAMLGVPREGFTDTSPPGRGFIDGAEVQVAVLGGTVDLAGQARAVETLAASMARAGMPKAPAIERLPEEVALAELPTLVDGLPAFGLSDATLRPIGFEPTGSLLVTGPKGSGRTTAVRTLVGALRRARPGVTTHYFGFRRSPLAGDAWDEAALGVDESAELALKLTEQWEQGVDPRTGRVVVIDGVGSFLQTDADAPLETLVKTCRTNGDLVIADGETADVTSSWPLLVAIKSARYGLVLQPDQSDGDQLFRTTFPRMNRADFPPGRGMLVAKGRAHRVQVAQT